jgi:hypothetical protein
MTGTDLTGQHLSHKPRRRPELTILTFLRNRETHPSVQSLHLIGSWDNFTTSYSMERDSRRGRGQWRGCHSFRDIISENEAPPTSRNQRRNGGLRMGHTYYYYVSQLFHDTYTSHGHFPLGPCHASTCRALIYIILRPLRFGYLFYGAIFPLQP